MNDPLINISYARKSMMALGRKFLEVTKPIIRRLPMAATVYRAVRGERRVLEEPRPTPLGFKFMGNKSMEEGNFEIEEVKIVKDKLSQVDVFVNVGANIGYYCCIALSMGKTTIAFEPIEQNLSYLYRNVLANDWDDIEIFPVALANKTGLIEIYGGGTGASLIKGWAGGPEDCHRLTPVSTLDNILQRRLLGKRCFFLVDIEGAEQLMLEGATTQLTLSPKPMWMIEISVKEHQPEGVEMNPNLRATFELMWKFGYKAYTCDRQFRCVTESEISKICGTGEDSLCVHNFLFM
jgi:FkbM family methyltransferase